MWFALVVERTFYEMYVSFIHSDFDHVFNVSGAINSRGCRGGEYTLENVFHLPVCLLNWVDVQLYGLRKRPTQLAFLLGHGLDGEQRLTLWNITYFNLLHNLLTIQEG